MTKPLKYRNARSAHARLFAWPVVQRVIEREAQTDKRAFEIGCGNGTTAQFLTDLGYTVAGIEPSKSEVEIANASFPDVTIHTGDVYEDLSAYGTFPLVISLEVLEHLYSPRALTQTVFDMIEPGGLGILSTPYHGYWKNLALAATGKMDKHFGVERDGGQIKFFSIKTLTKLLHETGFRDITIYRAGRIPPLAKSMIAIVRR